MASEDIFSLYFQLREKTEPPAIFHRWAITSCIGTWLSRNIWLPFGEKRIFPQQYVMFIGDPGSRKTTAIQLATSILKSCGFKEFAAQRTSKEKFLMDMAGEVEELPTTKKGMDLLDDISVLSDGKEGPREVLIAADEFNNFMGPGNLEFQSLLGELWDWDDETMQYEFRLKNSRPVNIFQPTVSILAGNTPTNFALCFPPAAVGQGFMSRLLLIHGQSTGRKISFPEPPDERLKNEVVRQFLRMRTDLHGPVTIVEEAKYMLDMLYRTWPELDDQRFKHYSTRRFTHLLRLCIVYAASRISMTVEPIDVIRANTVLAHAETLMPKALGELGKSKNSEAANKIMQALTTTTKPLTQMELWKIVRSDLDKPQDLMQVLSNLQYADQIIPVAGERGTKNLGGYIAKTKSIDRQVMYIDQRYLKGKELS